MSIADICPCMKRTRVHIADRHNGYVFLPYYFSQINRITPLKNLFTAKNAKKLKKFLKILTKKNIKNIFAILIFLRDLRRFAVKNPFCSRLTGLVFQSITEFLFCFVVGQVDNLSYNKKLPCTPCAFLMSMLESRAYGQPNRDDTEKWVAPTFLLCI